MDSINDSMARVLGSSRIPQPRAIAKAADCMKRCPITFRVEQHIDEVIDILIKAEISGGPVCDDKHRLLGMISEMDCLRALASGDYDGELHQDSRTVMEVMSTECHIVSPHDDIYRMAQLLERHNIRRLPVVDKGVLLGQVSRRDLLRAFRDMS